MPVTPSGTLSRALERLRATLADSAAFRAMIGPAAGQAEALARIHYDGLPPPAGLSYSREELAAYRPFALVYLNPNAGFRAEQDGVSGTKFDWAERGKAIITLEKEASETYANAPTADAEQQFRNEIGGIIDNLYSLSGTAPYLNITAISVLLGPYAVGEDDAKAEGVWQMVHLECEYGGIG